MTFFYFLIEKFSLDMSNEGLMNTSVLNPVDDFQSEDFQSEWNVI